MIAAFELRRSGVRALAASVLLGLGALAILTSAVGPVLASGTAPRDIARAALAAPPPPAPACTSAPFSDVPTNHPFCPEIQWMKDNAISTGFDDGTYRPSNNVTRQAMSAFLARVAGSTPPLCAAAPFSDVAAGHPFCKEIAWMKDNAISTGFDDGTYRPSNDVTRQAMSAFLARVAGATTPACASAPFSDVAVGHPFCKEIQWMKDNGISTGFDDGTYRPSNNVTRQAMSAFLYRVSFLIGALPVVTTSAGTAAYTEDGVAAAIDNALTLADADSANLEAAQVRISSGMQSGDALGFTVPQNGITGTYDSGTGVLTLSGTTTVANWQTALRTVTFSTTNNAPAAARTIAFKVNDGALFSDEATHGVTVTPSNDAPTVTTSAPALAVNEDDPAAVIDASLTVSDPDDTNLEGATIRVKASDFQTGDSIEFTNAAPISGSFVAGTGVMTLTGSGTLAQYQAALRTVTFRTVNAAPSSPKTIEFIVNDGSVNSVIATKVVNVTPVNDAPGATNLNAAETYIEDNDLNLTNIVVSDVDGGNLTATLTLSNTAAGALTTATSGTTTSTYVSGTGVWSASGPIADVNVLLAGVTFDPALNFNASLTIATSVSDGVAAALTGSKALTGTPVNDAPVAAAKTLTTSSGIRITVGAGDTSLQLKTGATDVDDVLADLSVSASFTNVDAGANVTLTDAATGTYQYNPAAGFTGIDTFNFQVCDDGAPTAPVMCGTGTVTATVNGTQLWFVDDSAAPGGTGRLTDPFDSLADLSAARGTGDRIFAFGGTYSTGLLMLGSEHFIGQGATGSSFDTLLGVQIPAAGTLDSRPSLGGTRPTVQGTITVVGNARVQGLNVTGSAGNKGIVATTGTGIVVTQVDVSTTGAAALELANAGGTFTFGSLSANGGANALLLTSLTGALSSTTTSASNQTAVGISIATSAATIALGNTSVISSAGDGVDLNANSGAVTFADLDITPDAGLRGLDATGNTGTITSTSGDVATTSAPAIVIAGPAGRTPLALVLNNVDSTNSTTTGVDLDLVSGILTVNDPGTATNIQNSTGTGIEVTNSGAGTITFGNTTVNASGNANADATGTGVVLTSNAGAITFGALTVTPDSGERGLRATDSTGTITATSGVLTTSGGATARAVDVDGPAGRTPINLTFTTVTTSGVGSSINLVDVSGTKFQVTGTTQINTRAGTGVFVDNSTTTTIQFATVNIPNPNNAGGNAFHVEDSSSAVTVATVAISDPFITSAQTDPNTDFFPDTDGDGDGIFLRGNSGLFTLAGGTISSPGNDGIDARTSRIAITGVTITNPGQDVTGATGQGYGGHGIAAINLSGANTITGTTISGFNVANRSGLVVNSNTGTVTLAVTGSTFQNSTGNAGVVGTTYLTGNLTLTIGGATNNVATNNTFTNISGSAVITSAADTSVLNSTIQNSTFQNSSTNGKTNVTGGTTQTATGTFTVINNRFTNVFRTASTGEALISIVALNSGGTNTFGVNISGNTINGVGLNSTACGGGATYCAGPLEAILVFVDDNTDVNGTIQINNNVITNVQQGGIMLDMANDQGGNIDAKITGNTVGTDAAPVGTGGNSVTNQFGINVQRRRLGAETANVLISGNSIRNGSAPFTNTINGNGIWARGQADTNLSVTITNNNINTLTTGGPYDIRIDANTVAVGDPDLAVVCADITGNTIAAGGLIDLNEATGNTLNIEQANSAAVSSSNSGATVSPDPGVAFGVACAAPPA